MKSHTDRMIRIHLQSDTLFPKNICSWHVSGNVNYDKYCLSPEHVSPVGLISVLRIRGRSSNRNLPNCPPGFVRWISLELSVCNVYIKNTSFPSHLLREDFLIDRYFKIRLNNYEFCMSWNEWNFYVFSFLSFFLIIKKRIQKMGHNK